MPESLKGEINSKTDPSVAKQYDHTTPMSQQFQELYEIIDKNKVSLMSTMRKSIGGLPVARSMAVAKRQGPDLLFLANKHSKKFEDLAENRDIHITFHDSSTQDWVSIAGTAATISNDDPRIKELYTPMISAWFGDAGDGIHNGTAEDPRMTLIEVKSKYIVYWKKTVSTVGFLKEVVQGAIQGDVAQTGLTREIFEKDLQSERRGNSPATRGAVGSSDNSTISVA